MYAVMLIALMGLPPEPVSTPTPPGFFPVPPGLESLPVVPEPTPVKTMAVPDDAAAKWVAGTKPARTKDGSSDALDEVNEYRAKRGLPPFKHDPLLTQAAYLAATKRASRGIHGHLPESDFTCLPAGARSNAAGCGALEDSWGWGSCLMDSTEYTYAGAAWVRGPGNLRYMHLFCGNGNEPEATRVTASTQLSAETCSTGTCGTSTAMPSRGLFRRRR